MMFWFGALAVIAALVVVGVLVVAVIVIAEQRLQRQLNKRLLTDEANKAIEYVEDLLRGPRAQG